MPSDSDFGGDVSFSGQDTSVNDNASLGAGMTGSNFGDFGGTFGGDSANLGADSSNGLFSNQDTSFIDNMGMFGDTGLMADNLANDGIGFGLGINLSDSAPQEDTFFNMLAKFAKSPFGKGLLNIAPMINPNLAPITRGISLINSSNSPRGGGATWGGFAGGLAGGAIGGPFGAMAGSHLGSMFGDSLNTGYGGGMPANDGQSAGGSDWLGSGIGALGQLYANQQNQRGMQGQINNLENMYGPNSPYAAQLRQQLERRDAAGGRRSQYGPREVELQAALAGQASRNAPGLAQLYQNRANMRNQNLTQLMALMQRAGGARGIMNGLSGMFNQQESMPDINFNDYPTPTFGDTGGMWGTDIGDMDYNQFGVWGG